jgi:nicotinamidase-related amidase
MTQPATGGAPGGHGDAVPATGGAPGGHGDAVPAPGGAPGGLGDGAPARWLAVIDMQRVFAEPDSAWFAPRFAEIVGPVRALVEAFRPRVTFTRFIAPQAPAGAWQLYYDQWPFALQPPGARIYELVDEFAGEPGRTLDATTFGKWNPELAARVGDGGRLVLAGVSTDCCVLSTAVAAADAGVAVQVVENACAGITDESHRQALAILRLYAPLVEVASLAEVVDLAKVAGS